MPATRTEQHLFRLPEDCAQVATVIAEGLELPRLEQPLVELLENAPYLPGLKGIVVGGIKEDIPVVEAGYVGDPLSWSAFRGIGIPSYASRINQAWRAAAVELASTPGLEYLSIMPHFLTDDIGQIGLGRFIDLNVVSQAVKEGKPLDRVGFVDPQVTRFLQRYTVMAIMQP